MRLLVAWLLLSLCNLAQASEETERAQIRARGDAVEAQHAQREQTCRKQFVVTQCLEKARADKQESLRALRAQELALDDAQRRQRAQAQGKRMAEKAQARAQPKPVPPPKEPLVPIARQTIKPASASASATDRSAAEKRQREAFNARHREIQAHRAEVEKRNAERAKRKVPKPLPVPASAAQL